MIDGLIEQLGQETTREICRLFVAQVTEWRDRMCELGARGDLRELARLAHGAKGMAANLGFTALESFCRALERVGKEGDDAGTALLLARLDILVAESLHALESRLPGVLAEPG